MTRATLFPDMRAITLVIASQRSGSTLLCQDIASLRGMGAPREYFLDILNQPKQPKSTPTEADVLACIAKGIMPSDPATGAVKLMVNYAPKIDAFIRNAPPVAPPQAVQNIIAWADANFDRVNLVALIRTNALDQAISRAVAGLTDIWHRRLARNPVGTDPYGEKKLAPRVLNMAILENLPAVLEQNAIIRDIARRNAERCLLIDYETLAASVEETSERIVAHARAFGFEPTRNLASRDLRKLIEADRAAAIRKDFRKFMEQRVKL